MKMFVLVGIVVLAACVWAGAASAKRNFVTPSGKIVCHATETEAWLGLICTSYWTRTSVALPSEFGKAYYTGFRPLYARDHLPFGWYWTWKYGHIRCDSARKGLTCRSSAGHGMFLSRGVTKVW